MKKMTNYINQDGIRTSLVLTNTLHDALDRLARKYGYTKRAYLEMVVSKSTGRLGNTDFIRDHIVNELMKLIPKKKHTGTEKMIIAWWDKNYPWRIDLSDDEALPWINANWIEKRPADEEEIQMYKRGIFTYSIKNQKTVDFTKKDR